MATDPATEHETVKQNDQPWTITKATTAVRMAWTYKSVIGSVAATGVKYYTVGPPQESWSIETALFIAAVRSLNQHRAANSNVPPHEIDEFKAAKASRKRLAMAETHNPKNGACADVAIPVRKRAGLQGILKDFDEQESGTRTIEAEWQLHNDARASPSDRVVLYLHGGGYFLLNRRCQRPITLLVSKMLNCRILSVDYRLCPETRFPGGLHDAVSAYLYLTQDLGVPPENIIVAGDSAGGGLSLALMLYLRDTEMPMIGGAYLLSPYCDGTSSLGSWKSNELSDYLAMPDRKHPMFPMNLYLGDKCDELILHPYVTSSLADLSGLPPMLIQAGGAETLRDEVTVLAHRAAQAGVRVRHEGKLDLNIGSHTVFEGGIHVFQAFVKTDAAVAAYKALREWYSSDVPSSKAGGDFGRANQLLDNAFAVRDGKLAKESKGKPKSTQQRVAREPRFVFEAVQKPAPTVAGHDGAFAELRKAAEAMQSEGDQNVTFIYEARRNEKAVGIVGKLTKLDASSKTPAPSQYESLSLKLQLVTAIMRTTDEAEARKAMANPDKIDVTKETRSKRSRLEKLGAQKPKQAVVLEVDIPVKHQGFVGELHTRPEDGSRRIDAEWELHDQVTEPRTDRMVLYVHGGGYSILSRKVYRPVSVQLSAVLNCPVLSTNYSLAPENPYPAAIRDIVSVYLHLTRDLEIPASSIIVAGDSSGAAMCLALMLYLRDNDMAMVSSSILFSPSCDLTRSFKSLDDNAAWDALHEPPNSCKTCPGRLYLSQQDQEFDRLSVKPYVSASISADFKGLPRLLVVTGSNEVLRDESVLLSQRAAHDGVDVTHEVYENGVHSFVVFTDEDVAVAAYANIAEWAAEREEGDRDSIGLRDIIDRLIEKRRAKGWNANQAKRKEITPKWVFERDDSKQVQRVRCRDEAHPKAKETLEGLERQGYLENVTTVYSPRRNHGGKTILL
ncbi:hypothetical protein OIV83_003096 [Microbotryomycetes sp. JL201]|nr:hypothetical protein OIV83_003096 [Microbotryomycetes sp. JL201]